MPRNFDNIKIIEPPIEELTKRRGGIGRTCLTGCLFIVIFLIVVFVGLRLAAGPGPQTLRTIPTDFPGDVPLYDRDNIEKITYISGQYKNRGLEVAAFFPKIILSPLFLNLNQTDSTAGDSATSTPWAKRWATVRDLWRVIATPVGNHNDTLQFEWMDLEADQKFIINYYKNELRKKNFEIQVESEGQNIMQFSFARATDGLSGSLYTKADPGYRNRTEYMLLTVNIGTSTTAEAPNPK